MDYRLNPLQSWHELVMKALDRKSTNVTEQGSDDGSSGSSQTLYTPTTMQDSNVPQELHKTVEDPQWWYSSLKTDGVKRPGLKRRNAVK